MNPGRIERILAPDDFQKSCGLHKGLVSKASDFLQFVPILERAMFAAVFVNAAGGEGIHAGDVAQQGRAGTVHVHADEVHARLDDAIERLLQVLGLHIMLIETDAQISGVDLHHLRQRIEQPAANGDGSSLEGVELRQLFAAEGAGAVDAGSRLVDDGVGQFPVL